MSGPGAKLIAHLNSKNTALVAELDCSEFCKSFFSRRTSKHLIELLIASLLHQVGSYGGQLTRSICTALGRLANDPKWVGQVGPLFEAVLGEVRHPQMAHDDSVKLDPDLKTKKIQTPSPAAFIVGATARLLCQEAHPLTHLGFFYLLEGTTAVMAPRLARVLRGRGVSSPFMKLHATEDKKHATNLKKKICEIVDRDPAVAKEINYGYDCFALAYPLPVWHAAWERAISLSQMSRGEEAG